MRPLRVASALMSAALLALALGACGSSSQDPKALLKETFSGAHKVRSGKLMVSLQMTPLGGAAASTYRLTGPFQSLGPKQLPKFALQIQLSANGTNLAGGATSTGDKGFLNVRGSDYAVPDQLFGRFRTGYQQSVGKSPQQGAAAPGLLGLHPITWLKSPKTVGEQDVGGTATNHVRGDVDVPKLLADVSTSLARGRTQGLPGGTRVPTQITPQQRQQIQRSVKSASVDVFSGKEDKALRRLEVTVNLNPAPAGTTTPGLGGSAGGTLRFVQEIDDLNQGQTITPPARTKPLSDLQAQLGGLGAGAGSSGGSGGAPPPPSSSTPPSGSTPPPSGGSASPSQGTVKRYSQCLAKAGSDQTKAQACANLLQP